MASYAGIKITMVATRSSEQRRAFGEFVRAQREKVLPAAIGLTPGNRRRTPGLRREEVAQLCGLSTTWFTWIEQGRDVSISAGALARLATALQLGRAERAYLFDLAGKRDPEQGKAETATATVSAALAACVDVIAAPAYILDRFWHARTWNAAAARLFVGWLDAPGAPNLLHFTFTHPAAPSLICDWEVRARRLANEFRAASSMYVDDPRLQAFVADLRRDSEKFAQFWDQHGVLGREGGERTFNHPDDGFLRYEQVTFDVANQPDLKMTILVPLERIPKCDSGVD
jgi:transcriptional regulator with XRE-family HTH domain